jgi:hypothetical protein
MGTPRTYIAYARDICDILATLPVARRVVDRNVPWLIRPWLKATIEGWDGDRKRRIERKPVEEERSADLLRTRRAPPRRAGAERGRISGRWPIAQ